MIIIHIKVEIICNCIFKDIFFICVISLQLTLNHRKIVFFLIVRSLWRIKGLYRMGHSEKLECEGCEHPIPFDWKSKMWSVKLFSCTFMWILNVKLQNQGERHFINPLKKAQKTIIGDAWAKWNYFQINIPAYPRTFDLVNLKILN